ncbi:MAG: hypothetical protein ACK518_02790 [bacterium]
MKAAGGRDHQEMVKFAWQKIAAPTALQFINWTGQKRTDRSQKTGLVKSIITKNVIAVIRSTVIGANITDQEFKRLTNNAIRHAPATVKAMAERKRKELEERERANTAGEVDDDHLEGDMDEGLSDEG